MSVKTISLLLCGRCGKHGVHPRPVTLYRCRYCRATSSRLEWIQDPNTVCLRALSQQGGVLGSESAGEEDEGKRL